MSAPLASDKSRALKFEWLVQGWKNNPFEVVRFQGEEGLSQPYRFVITIACSDSGLALSKLLKASCCFRLHQQQGLPQDFHGMLSEVRILSSTYQTLYLQVTLVPRLWALTLGCQCKVFLNQSLPEILKTVLTDQQQHGVMPAFTLKLMRNYPAREFVCQYNESSLQFIARLMEQAGLYYYFEQREQQEHLIITDHQMTHQSKPNTQPVRYYPSQGDMMAGTENLLTQFTAIIGHLPNQVLLKGYNHERSSQVVLSKGKVEHPSAFSKIYQSLMKQEEVPESLGTYYRYGEHFTQQADGDQLVKNSIQQLQHQANYYEGESRVPWLQAGYLCSLQDHFLDSFNQSYLVTQVSHRGDQSAELKMPVVPIDAVRYSNSFIAINSSYQYRHPCRTPRPLISGVIIGTIDASGSGEQAMLDKQGRYKVILPFDLSGKHSGKASHWLRLAQPYGGKKGGMHFPLCKGTEVLIAFIHGDPDQPIIQSTLPNADNPSVVTEKNAAVNKLCTPSGNKITLDDTSGSRSITLSNGGGTITLGDI
jgi:type VI secretion system secreted protein VgrG